MALYIAQWGPIICAFITANMCMLSVQMGILPTDTYPALVCDIEARKAVERLYAAKGMKPTKQLSILVRNYSDINTYTLGFPSTEMGQDTFRLARRALPGPVRPPIPNMLCHSEGLAPLSATEDKQQALGSNHQNFLHSCAHDLEERGI
jgi:hypothetical protein